MADEIRERLGLVRCSGVSSKLFQPTSYAKLKVRYLYVMHVGY